MSGKPTPLTKPTNTQDCVILGNGPSLTKAISGQREWLNGKALFCVNHFAESEIYSELRPTNYVLNAPEMWMDDVEEAHYKKGEKLFDSIAKYTTWPLNLYIPIASRKFTRWKKRIKQNKNIKIHYFNTTPIQGFQFFSFFCFKKGLGLPRPHNVLIPTIVLSCNLGFEKIYLWGADHSWLKDIWVNDNNLVLLTQKHFYDQKSATPKPMDKLGKGSRKLHEILQKFAYAFEGYFILRNYAGWRGNKIINATPDSYIDAFERLKIGDQT